MQYEKETVELKLETGAVVLDGRYEVLSEIGKGGMGAVFLAKQLSTGKRVAVKFIHAHNVSEKLLERFKKEASFMSSLSHPNLVTLLDYGVDENDSPFLVMDYIEGEAFSARLKREPKLSERELSVIFMQIVKAVGYLHSKKIIHRDLKPSNIVVLQDIDGEPLVKLLDLGIAKSAHEAPDASEVGQITETGDVIGSPAYMSPEQAMGQPLDARSDIYSLGCMVYECLTGRLPFTGETAVQLISQRLVNEAPPITDATVAPHLVPVAMKCLARDPNARYADCNELIEGLRKASTFYRAANVTSKKSFRLGKTGRIVIGAVAAVAIVGIVGYFASRSFSPEMNMTDNARRDLVEKLATESKWSEAARVARIQIDVESRRQDRNESDIFADTVFVGDMESRAGNLVEANKTYKNALDQPVSSVDQEQRANILMRIGKNSIASDDPLEGLELMNEAFAICQKNKLTDSTLAGEICMWRGLASLKQAEFLSSNRAVEKAQTAEMQARDYLLQAIAIVEPRSQDDALAKVCLEESVKAIEQRKFLGPQLRDKAKALMAASKYRQAAIIFRNLIDSGKQGSQTRANDMDLLDDYFSLGKTLHYAKDYQAANDVYEEAEKYFGKRLAPIDKTDLDYNRGFNLAWAGRRDAALQYLDQADSSLRKRGEDQTLYSANILLARGDAYFRDDKAKAKDCYLKAIKIFEKHPESKSAQQGLKIANDYLKEIADKK